METNSSDEDNNESEETERPNLLATLGFGWITSDGGFIPKYGALEEAKPEPTPEPTVDEEQFYDQFEQSGTSNESEASATDEETPTDGERKANMEVDTVTAPVLDEHVTVEAPVSGILGVAPPETDESEPVQPTADTRAMFDGIVEAKRFPSDKPPTPREETSVSFAQAVALYGNTIIILRVTVVLLVLGGLFLGVGLYKSTQRNTELYNKNSALHVKLKKAETETINWKSTAETRENQLKVEKEARANVQAELDVAIARLNRANTEVAEQAATIEKLNRGIRELAGKVTTLSGRNVTLEAKLKEALEERKVAIAKHVRSSQRAKDLAEIICKMQMNVRGDMPIVPETLAQCIAGLTGTGL